MTSGKSARQRWLRGVSSVFLKDIRSELRTRYAISALLMFVLSTISIIVFSVGGLTTQREVFAGMLWVVIFFSSMSGLSRTFVAEEERGTTLTLQLVTSPGAVLFGKLAFNIVLILCINVTAVGLYLALIPEFTIQSDLLFWLVVLMGSVGLASAATIIAAIIAKANTKGTLFPVLSFPILLPLLVVVINATRLASEGAPLEEAGGEFQFLVAYIVAMITVSNLLFDHIWRD
jgi:heme exporter protein B